MTQSKQIQALALSKSSAATSILENLVTQTNTFLWCYRSISAKAAASTTCT